MPLDLSSDRCTRSGSAVRRRVLGMVLVVAAIAASAALRRTDPAGWWGRGFAVSTAGHLARLVLAGFLFASAWATGDTLLDLLRRSEPSPRRLAAWALHSLRITLGLTLLSLVLFGMAAWQLWTPWGFGVLLASQAAVFLGRLRRVEFRSACAFRCRWLLAAAGILGLLLAALFVLPSLITSLAPPIGWDDQVYHLPLSAAYLRHGGFFAMPWNFFAQQPGMLDLLFGWGLALGDPLIPALIHAGLGLTVCLGLWEISVRLGWRRAAPFAAVLFLCHYMVGEEMGWAFTDVGMAAFLLPAAWVLWRWGTGHAGRTGWIIAGMLAGMVCASKYTGVLFVVGVAAWVLILGVFPHPSRSSSRASTSLAPSALARMGGMLGFVVLGFLVLLPWLVRNWACTGNPVWPLAYGVFGGAEWDAPLTDQLVTWQWESYGRGHALVDWILLLPRIFLISDYAPSNFGGSLAALPLVGAIVAVLVPGSGRKRIVTVVVGFLILFGFWSAGSHQSRFLIPALPLLSLAAVGGVQALFRGAPIRRMLIAGALVVALIANFMETLLPRWTLAAPSVPMLLGREAREPFLAARVRSFQCFRFVESLPARERGRYVLFLYEPMGFYAEFPYRFDVLYASTTLERALAAGSPEAFARQLGDDGVFLVLVNHEIYDQILPILQDPPPFDPFGGNRDLLDRYRQGLRILDDFLRERTLPLFRANNSAVYRVFP